MLRMPYWAPRSGSASVSTLASRIAGLELARRLLELRRHHLARPAPRRPEIDQHRDVAALDVPRERGRGQLDRVRP